MEKRGERLNTEQLRSFDQCRPTFAHRAIQALIKAELVHFVVSQNIDGLFLKSGISRAHLAELHGNYFLDQCSHCHRRFVRTRPSPTMGCKPTGDPCPRRTPRPCRGVLTDTILDWEQSLPENELILSEKQSQHADLAICLGTTLQIEPAGSLPLRVIKKKSQTAPATNGTKANKNKRKVDKVEPKEEAETEDKKVKTESQSTDLIKSETETPKSNIPIEIKKEEESDSKPPITEPTGKLVIINLQPTRFDKKATLLVHHYIDRIMELVCSHLNIPVPEYDPNSDPTNGDNPKAKDLIEWKRK